MGCVVGARACQQAAALVPPCIQAGRGRRCLSLSLFTALCFRLTSLWFVCVLLLRPHLNDGWAPHQPAKQNYFNCFRPRAARARPNAAAPLAPPPRAPAPRTAPAAPWQRRRARLVPRGVLPCPRRGRGGVLSLLPALPRALPWPPRRGWWQPRDPARRWQRSDDTEGHDLLCAAPAAGGLARAAGAGGALLARAPGER